MRVSPGTTLDEEYGSLTKRQQNKIAAIESARQKEDAQVKALVNRSREAVRKALEADVPARIIADRLGVSAARVYQLRDAAEQYAEAKSSQ